MVSKLIPQTCCHPTCTAIGVIRIADTGWLCTPHIIERACSPDNMELMQADRDLDVVRRHHEKTAGC